MYKSKAKEIKTLTNKYEELNITYNRQNILLSNSNNKLLDLENTIK